MTMRMFPPGEILELLRGVDSSSMMITIAVFALLAQTLLWLGYFRLQYGPRRWWLRLLDVDSYPAGSLWEAMQEVIGMPLGRDAIDPSAVVSPTRKYQLIEPLVSGDLCNVYRATSPVGTVAIKIPRVDGCGQLIAKEQMILRRIQAESSGTLYRKYFPTPVETFQFDGRLHSVLRYRRGYFNAAQILEQHPPGLDARHLAWMFNRTLEALGVVHRLGWIHGAVLPPHLLFHPAAHGMQLIGWTHAVPIGTPLRVVSKEFKSWYPPECERRESASVALDIHLAAKSMIYLAGGDPLGDELPDHLPIEIGVFFRECLSMTRGDRTNAWRLHEQFRELLENLFGPPRFCHLTMS